MKLIFLVLNPACLQLSDLNGKWVGTIFFLITHISCPFNFLPLDDYDDFLFCLFKSKKYMDSFRAFFINSLYVTD